MHPKIEGMQARVRTVAFHGVDVVPVDVQVLIAPGTLAFAMVGLADKAVGESRERVRAALRALGLALPPQRISVNLSPADLAKAEPAAGLLKDLARGWSKPRCNADTDGAPLEAVAEPDAEGRALLTRAAERLGLSARAWHRTLRVVRTLADLDGSDAVRRLHIAEALSYRRSEPRSAMAAEGI